MKCEYPLSRTLIGRRLHLIQCRECRANSIADQVISHGIAHLKAEPISTAGMSATLETFRGTNEFRSTRNTGSKARKRNRLLTLGSMTAFATIGVGGWLCYIDYNPKIVYPEQTMPSPNSYHILVQAAVKMPASDIGSNSLSPDYSHSKVRYALICNSEAKPPQITVDAAKGQVKYNTQAELNVNHFYTFADKESILNEYSKTLTLIRQSFSHPFQTPISTTIDEVPIYNQRYYQFQNLLELEVQVKIGRKDYLGAANSSLDLMELGMLITHKSGLSERRSAVNLQRKGREGLRMSTWFLNSNQNRSVIQRLERIIQETAPYADSLEKSKWENIANNAEAMKNNSWRADVVRGYQGNQADPDRLGDFASFLMLHRYSKGCVLDMIAKSYDREIEDARLPYLPHRNKIKVGIRSISDLKIQFANSDMFETNSRWRRVSDMVETDVKNTLLMTYEAMIASKKDHGFYPKAVSELVPEYLSKIPLDPFRSNAPLCLKWNKYNQLSLYSVGPDGIDNGGLEMPGAFPDKPYDPANASPDISYILN